MHSSFIAVSSASLAASWSVLSPRDGHDDGQFQENNPEKRLMKTREVDLIIWMENSGILIPGAWSK